MFKFNISLRFLGILVISCLIAFTYASPARFENFRQKRAINPFMDSIGKRAINPFTDTIGKRSEYEPFYGPMEKRYFDSLAGQSLGKRSSYLLYARR